jgi:hypothetical protein
VLISEGMTGETDLRRLLGGTCPLASATKTNRPGCSTDVIPTEGPVPVMSFLESEGMTLIVAEDEARAKELVGTFACRMITLNVHSSLEAVGFLAAITHQLAQAGMGVNPASAFYHDHLFVPADRAGEALRLLAELSAANRQSPSPGISNSGCSSPLPLRSGTLRGRRHQGGARDRPGRLVFNATDSKNAGRRRR